MCMCVHEVRIHFCKTSHWSVCSICTHTCAYECTCSIALDTHTTHTHTTHTHPRTHICVHTCPHTHMCVHICLHTHISIPTCVYTHVHVHTHTCLDCKHTTTTQVRAFSASGSALVHRTPTRAHCRCGGLLKNAHAHTHRYTTV